MKFKTTTTAPQVLMTLVNNGMLMGYGRMDPNASNQMTDKQAEEICVSAPHLSFDYVWGRPIKVNLKDLTKFDPWGYDRDNGRGAAERVLREAGLLEDE